MLMNLRWSKVVFWAAVSAAIPGIGHAEKNDVPLKTQRRPSQHRIGMRVLESSCIPIESLELLDFLC